MSAPAKSSSGNLTRAAHTLLDAFVDKATPADMLKLAELVKEAREVEHRVDVAKENIAANRDIAMKTIALRDRVLTEVVRRRLDRTDRALDTLISKLEGTSDPAEITAVAQAIASVATTDSFSDVAELVSALKSDQIDLEF